MKRLSDLTTGDLAKSPIWEYTSGPDNSVYVEPVDCLPVTDLRNRIVGTRVVLHSGDVCWAILGNIDLRDRQSTEHFLTLSVEKDARWFDLARYHDVDYARRGPEQLAQFLALPVVSIFPIEYDVSGLVNADPGAARGTISLEPERKLSQDELIELALKRDGV